MRLSVVIPCYNEESRINPTLQRVESFLLSKRYGAEIVAVDDGSSDGTLAALERFRAGRRVPVQVVSYQPNKGKANAVREGVLAARGEVILFTDADLSTPIEEIESFLPILEGGEADIVIGSRNLPSSQVTRPKGREMMSKGFNLLVRMMLLPGIRDTQCGFKCFARAAALAVFEKEVRSGLAFDVEILYIARRLGYRIVEVPVRWDYASGSKVQPVRDSARMLAAVLQLRAKALLGRYRPRPRAG